MLGKPEKKLKRCLVNLIKAQTVLGKHEKTPQVLGNPATKAHQVLSNTCNTQTVHVESAMYVQVCLKTCEIPCTSMQRSLLLVFGDDDDDGMNIMMMMMIMMLANMAILEIMSMTMEIRRTSDSNDDCQPISDRQL